MWHVHNDSVRWGGGGGLMVADLVE